MWEQQQRERFQQLRQRESVLTEAERAELAALVQELETAEAAYLAPATERLRHDRETIDAQNRSLEILTRRKEALAQRLRDFLTETQAEQRAIESELAAVLASGQGPETDR
jgi:hypothetical protein